METKLFDISHTAEVILEIFIVFHGSERVNAMVAVWDEILYMPSEQSLVVQQTTY